MTPKLRLVSRLLNCGLTFWPLGRKLCMVSWNELGEKALHGLWKWMSETHLNQTKKWPCCERGEWSLSLDFTNHKDKHMNSPRILDENVIMLDKKEKDTCDHIVFVLRFPKCKFKDSSRYSSTLVTTLRGMSNILREIGFPVIILMQWSRNQNMLPFPFCSPLHGHDYKPCRVNLFDYSITVFALSHSSHFLSSMVLSSCLSWNPMD